MTWKQHDITGCLHILSIFESVLRIDLFLLCYLNKFLEMLEKMCLVLEFVKNVLHT